MPGWADRLTQHLIDAKAPIPEDGCWAHGNPACTWCYCENDRDARIFEDFFNAEAYWAAAVFPSLTVEIDDLVHRTYARTVHALCGAYVYVDGLPFDSTDDAAAWVAKQKRLTVTCMYCVTGGAPFEEIP